MSEAPNPHHLTLVEQLRALAGVPPETNEFDIVRDGRTIHVVFTTGSTDSLGLTTKVPTAAAETRRIFDGYRGGKESGPVVAPRPLAIRLRREDADDKYHKESGVNREVQTGDERFDEVVYIDTYAPPEAVRGILASPDARAAAMDLLVRDCTRFIIDDPNGDVHLDIVEFSERSPDQARGARLVDNLTRLANALTPVRASGERPAEDTTLLPIGCGCMSAFAGLIGAPIIYLTQSPDRCVESHEEGMSLICGAGPECCNPAFTGLLAGALVSVPIVFVLGRVVRGHSDSHTSMRILQFTAFLLCCEFAVVVSRFFF